MAVYQPATGPQFAEVTLAEVLLILRRRRMIVLLVCVICLGLAAIKCVFGTRRYESTASIQVQKEASDSLGIENALGSAAEGASDALDYNITLQTQAKILTSETLALAVIGKTGLESNDDFTGRNAWLKLPEWLIAGGASIESDAPGLPLEASPGRRRRALKTFSKHLSVKIEPGTRIIDIGFLSTNPALAANVVNCLIREFTEYTYKTRFAATEQVSDWLASQLHGLQVKAEQAQARKVKLQTQTGLFGEDAGHNVVLARLDELSSGWTRAQSDRMLAEALDKVMRTGDPDLIEALGAGSSAVGSSAIASSLGLLQQLRSRLAETRTQLSLSRQKFGPNYPLVLEQQAQEDSVQRSIREELRRVAASAHREYEMSRQVESASLKSVEEQKLLLGRLGRPTLEYTMAKQEADSSRDLYESLSTKLTAASVLSGLQSSNVTVVDPGREAARNHPKQPNVPVTMAIGGLMGIVAGCALALFLNFRDMRLYTAAQIEQLLGVPLLAILPVFRREATMTSAAAHWLSWPPRLSLPGGASTAGQTAASLDNDSAYAEALRSLRTSLMLSRSQGHPKLILVTSALPGEGKSTTALNFATIVGQQGGRVLVVDGDLRRPTLHQRLKIGNAEGLSSLLSLGETGSALRRLPGKEDIWVLTTGPRPPYPAELLGSERMNELLAYWRGNFDFVIIDSPPVLPVTDAVLLSERVDAVLMVARYGVSTRKALERGYGMLTRHAGEGKVNVILNGIERGSVDFGEHYGYEYHYGTTAKTVVSLHAEGSHAS